MDAHFSTSRRVARSAVVIAALALGFSVCPMPTTHTAQVSASTTPAVFGLTQGARGEAVKLVQQALVNQGVAVGGGVDGIFGAATTLALKSFQASKGVSASGAVDEATALALGLATSPLLGLTKGVTGPAVKQLQTLLIASSVPVNGGADGIFGNGTAAALVQYQTAHGFKATGTVDFSTAGALGGVTMILSPATPAPLMPAAVVVAPPSPLLGLAYGALGANVKSLQVILASAGLTLLGGPDGVFGTATLAALKKFQAAKGLTQTGKVDQATATALSDVALNLLTLAPVISTPVAPIPAPSPFVGLKSGSVGAAVKQLQTALIAAGVSLMGGVDGIFGPATSNGLREFQASQGINQSGLVDAATIAALASPKPAVSQSASTEGFAVYGEVGPRVTTLQNALIAAGFTVRGGADGDFGVNTTAAVMDFQRAKSLNVTGKVNAETATALGLITAALPVAAAGTSVTLMVFPVQGWCGYGDSWGYPRPGGRRHLGVDIIAAKGKLIYATDDGTITKTYVDYPGSLAGNGVRLTRADGTYMFYAHMTGLADGIGVGVPVVAGQVIGFVGSTGSSSTPHVHFEVHPFGGAAVNPYPIVKAIDACKVTEPLPVPAPDVAA